MVEIINDTITIPNWEKHQSLDSYEKKKERDRLYQKERRNKQKMLTEKKSSDESSDVAISEEDIEEDIDIDIDIEKDIEKENDNENEKKELFFLDENEKSFFDFEKSCYIRKGYNDADAEEMAYSLVLENRESAQE